MLTANELSSRGVLVEVVDDDLRIAVAFQFDDHARVLVRFVPDRRDVGQMIFSFTSSAMRSTRVARFTL